MPGMARTTRDGCKVRQVTYNSVGDSDEESVHHMAAFYKFLENAN